MVVVAQTVDTKDQCMDRASALPLRAMVFLGGAKALKNAKTGKITMHLASQS